MNDGSVPQACSATTSIDVVDVLPALPDTHAARWSAMSSASTAERWSTGMPRAAASSSSGLSGSAWCTAFVVTRQVGPPGRRSRLWAS